MALAIMCEQENANSVLHSSYAPDAGLTTSESLEQVAWVGRKVCVYNDCDLCVPGDFVGQLLSGENKSMSDFVIGDTLANDGTAYEARRTGNHNLHGVDGVKVGLVDGIERDFHN
jgi:hypothetical protein